MSVFMIDLYFASRHGNGLVAGKPVSLAVFLTGLNDWRMLLDVLFLSISGGVFIVPLYAMLQRLSNDSNRSQMIAANNIINSFFMVIASVIIMVLLTLRFTIPQIFLVLGLLNLLVAFYICRLLPEAVLKSFVCWILKACYQVKVVGLENYHKAGPRTIIIANHVSFLDGILLAAFLPKKMMYAIHFQLTQVWWIKPFIELADVFPIEPTKPMLMKTLIKKIRQDRHCLIFPEGRITNTGALMKIYEGPGMIADKSDSEILPIRIDGPQYSRFSRLKGKQRLRWFPKVTLTILPPTRFNVPAEIRGRKRRQYISAQLYDLMSDLIVTTSNYQQTLFESLLDAAKIHGGKQIILEDIERKKISYRRFIMGCFALGRHINKSYYDQRYIGILMPNMVATGVCFFALQSHGHVPVMLNFSGGQKNVLIACRSAEIETVYTSREFIKRARLAKMIEGLDDAGITIQYLEDVREELSSITKFKAFLYSRFPSTFYNRLNPNASPRDAAVVLFTSGSEGVPKGVVLSHANILANRIQLSARIDFTTQDRVFNSLPLFHAFGLTGGMIMPLLSGVKTFLYPSPLHFRVIPELIYDTNSTLFFATDTFLSAYARVAHPYDFYSVRYVFSGAERLKPETVKIWSEKFGVRLLEAYGATETAPGLTMNTAMQHKAGTVGRLLPLIDYRIKPVPGIEKGGRLIVSGPNIMLGYLLPDNPGKIVPPEGGWYDTGDIVSVDEQGYFTVLGRAKRFAKVAGEMISLTAVETYITDLWPDNLHAIIAIPDPRRGEQLVLVTDYMDAHRKEIITYFREEGIGEVFLPRKILPLKKLFLLATGKIDYAATNDYVLETLK